MIAIEPVLLKSSPAGAAVRRRPLSRFLASAANAVGLRGEVSVLLTSDDRIRTLNRDFRGKNQATDVLSFPSAPPFFEGGHCGDLAISLDTALRQATERGHTVQLEVEVLMLHGLLHLAGFDHETDSGEMARREIRLRKQLALPPGLLERGNPRIPRTPRKTASPLSPGNPSRTKALPGERPPSGRGLTRGSKGLRP